MKVILRADLEKKGEAGDLIDVADGYARNYLIPRGLAVEATPGNIKRMEQEHAVIERRKAKEAEAAKEVADKLENVGITLTAKAGEGRLFGSITSMDIAEALSEKVGVEIDKRKIDLEEPIKELGDYDITIKFTPTVFRQVSVHVVPEGGEAVVEEAPVVEQPEEEREEQSVE
jgi:large subunit ribosomal protein L9